MEVMEDIIKPKYKILTKIEKNTENSGWFAGIRVKDNKKVLFFNVCKLGNKEQFLSAKKEIIIASKFRFDVNPNCIHASNNVNKCIDVFISLDQVYYVVNYFPGIPLSMFYDNIWKKKECCSTINHFLKISIELVQCLYQLLQNKIIPALLCPCDIFINEETFHCKISSFQKRDFGDISFSDDRLGYLSPEGSSILTFLREKVDSRSPLYSLGVMLYQLLVKKLPFYSEDKLELIHMHFTNIPQVPSSYDTQIPEVLSNIVMKLLKKSPNDRYQSCYGIKKDLELCLEMLLLKGKIENFELGRFDRFSKVESLRLSKFYGRSKEIQKTIELFNKSLNLKKSVVLKVKGVSGIGKTRFIWEVKKQIINQCLFVSGKLSQNGEKTSWVNKIFSELFKLMLFKGEKKKWKDLILDRISIEELQNIIYELVPSLDLIVGKDILVKKEKKKNNFSFSLDIKLKIQIALTKLLKIFADKERVLIFIDDVQWIDYLSEAILSYWICDEDLRKIFFIASHRPWEDNSVGSKFFEKLKKNKNVKINEIVINKIEDEEISHMLGDNFEIESENLNSLTKIVSKKTKGNPFFLINFINEFNQNFINFSTKKVDIEEIKTYLSSTSSIDLLIQKLKKLTPQHLEVLKTAFFFDMGSSINYPALSKFLKEKEKKVFQILKYLESIDLLVRLDSKNFCFYHDKILEILQLQISPEEEKRFCLKIGQYLLEENRSSLVIEKETIFRVLFLLNKCEDIILEKEKRIEIAKLNLEGIKLAKEIVSFDRSLTFFKHGIKFIGESEKWSGKYIELTFKFYLEYGYLKFIEGDLNYSKRIISECLDKAHDTSNINHIVRLNILLIQIETNLGNFRKAIDIGIRSLKLCNTHIKEESKEFELEKLKNYLEIAKKINLKKMLKERKIKNYEKGDISGLKLTILNELIPATYLFLPKLCVGIKCEMFKSFLNSTTINGSLISSVFFFFTAVCHHLREYKFSYEMCVTLLDYLKKNKMYASLCVCIEDFDHGVAVFSSSIHDFIGGEELVKEYGLMTGNIRWVSYSKNTNLVYSFYGGIELEKMLAVAKTSLAFAKKVKSVFVVDIIRSFMLIFQNLMNKNSHLFEKCVKEQDIIEELKKNHSFYSLFNFYCGKAYLLLLFRKFKICLKVLEEARELEKYCISHISNAIFSFCETLCYMNIDYEKYKVKIQENMEFFKNISDSPTFDGKYVLLSAEYKRIKIRPFGNDREKQEIYEMYLESISISKNEKFLNDEAFASECLGMYLLEIGKLDLSNRHINISLNLYLKWGAVRKVEEMKRDFNSKSDLLSEFDYLGLNKLSALVSSILKLKELTTKIIEVFCQYSGSSKGVLIIKKQIIAEKNYNQNFKYCKLCFLEKNEEGYYETGLPYEKCECIPKEIVKIVYETRKTFSINDVANSSWSNKYVLTRNKVKSVICFPIPYMNTIIGVIFLSSDKIRNIFTPEKERFLNTLCLQVYAPIKNSLNFQKMQKKIEFIGKSSMIY